MSISFTFLFYFNSNFGHEEYVSLLSPFIKHKTTASEHGAESLDEFTVVPRSY